MRKKTGFYTRAPTKRKQAWYCLVKPTKSLGNGCSSEKVLRASEFMRPMSSLRRIDLNRNHKVSDHKRLEKPKTFEPGVVACCDSSRKSDPTIASIKLTEDIGSPSIRDINLRELFAEKGSKTVHVFPDAPMSIVLQMFLDGKDLVIVHDVNDEDQNADPFYEEVGFISHRQLMLWVAKRSWASQCKLRGCAPGSVKRRNTMM
uniref:Uncharacterized protein n=1 Tax=Lotharella globosa TaxID=91324 RepID=A0A7S4DWG4_9EUKA|mmetsp:Transcript_7634/g.14185  ORF Transcript_7634/g.14185 Transcript_7634/m.14185 type:complete len:203 (+) Transcript_7634:89-697(+)